MSNADLIKSGTFDDDLPSDIETTKGASFDNVTGIIGFPWIDREDLIIVHIHLWSEEVQEHEP